MPCCGMAHARIGFGACQLLFAQRDLRLVPELDPFVLDRLVELEPRGDRGGMPSLSSWMILTIVSVSNGFLSTGSI